MTPVIIAIILVILYYAYKGFNQPDQSKQLSELMRQIPQPGTTIPMSHFRQVVDQKDQLIGSIQHSLETVQKDLAKLKGEQQSKSVRLGQISEQVIPFHKDFPYDYKKLKPMFQPVDYVYFGEEEIVFLELKMGTSQLSDSQRNIRRLVNEGKVYFKEFRVDEDGVKLK